MVHPVSSKEALENLKYFALLFFVSLSRRRQTTISPSLFSSSLTVVAAVAVAGVVLYA